MFVLVLTLLLGWRMVKRAPLELHWLTTLGWIFPLGLLIISWLSFISVAISNFQLGLHFMYTAVSLGVGIDWWLNDKHRWPQLKWLGDTHPTGLILLTGLAVLFLSLFQTRMMWNGAEGWYSGGGSWGDLAMHTSFIYGFTDQIELSLRSPIYAQENTTYPFLINFYTALVMRSGASLHAALTATGWGLAISSALLLYTLSWQLAASKKTALTAAIFTCLVFFFNGGLGWLYFVRDIAVATKPWWEFLSSFGTDYTMMPEHHVFWANVITTHLLPQRGFLAGLPLFLICLQLWRTTFDKPTKLSTLIWISLITAATPFMYVHTFLVLIGLYLGLSAYLIIIKKQAWQTWIIPTLVLISLAAPQLCWQFSQSLAHNRPHLWWGWMRKNDESWWWFWWQNMGLLGPITVASGYYLWHTKSNSEFLKILWLLLLCCFGLCNIILFQAYDWNNLKFLLLCQVGFSLAIGQFLATIWSKNIFTKALVIILIFFATASGWLAVLKELNTHWLLVTTADIETAQAIRQTIPATSIILTSSQHNHLVPMLTGRPIVMGYPGWLWTHGVDYRQTERDVATMYAGTDQTLDLLKKYHIEYVVISHFEREQLEVNQQYFDDQFPVIIESESTKIYKINF